MASERGNMEIVKILLDKGIDLNQHTHYGFNALHWASERGHKEIVEFLIEQGINDSVYP